MKNIARPDLIWRRAAWLPFIFFPQLVLSASLELPKPIQLNCSGTKVTVEFREENELAGFHQFKAILVTESEDGESFAINFLGA